MKRQGRESGSRRKRHTPKRPPAVPRGEGARLSLRLWCNDSLPREEGMGGVSRKIHRDEAAAERVSHIKDSGCSFSRREIAWMAPDVENDIFSMILSQYIII